MTILKLVLSGLVMGFGFGLGSRLFALVDSTVSLWLEVRSQERSKR